MYMYIIFLVHTVENPFEPLVNQLEVKHPLMNSSEGVMKTNKIIIMKFFKKNSYLVMCKLFLTNANSLNVQLRTMTLWLSAVNLKRSLSSRLYFTRFDQIRQQLGRRPTGLFCFSCSQKNVSPKVLRQLNVILLSPLSRLNSNSQFLGGSDEQ